MKSDVAILTCCGLTGVHQFPFDRQFDHLPEGHADELAKEATDMAVKWGTAGLCILNGVQTVMIEALKRAGWEVVKTFQNPLAIHPNEKPLSLMFYDTQGHGKGEWELQGDKVHIKPQAIKRYDGKTQSWLMTL